MCEAGYDKKIILSHDAMFLTLSEKFLCFIKNQGSIIALIMFFQNYLKKIAEQIMSYNVLKMLKCEL